MLNFLSLVVEPAAAVALVTGAEVVVAPVVIVPLLVTL
jgi:hypothetical protein